MNTDNWLERTELLLGNILNTNAQYLSRELAALGINMTKLESCPVTGRNFEFIFFLELEASVQEPGVLPMLEELERSCADFNFLGSYAEV